MDLFFDFLMELIPEALTEWFLNHYVNVIKKHVNNTILQKVLIVAGAILAIVFSIAIAFGVLCLLGFLIFRIFKL